MPTLRPGYRIRAGLSTALCQNSLASIPTSSYAIVLSNLLYTQAKEFMGFKAPS